MALLDRTGRDTALWISRQVLREYLATVTRPQGGEPALPLTTALQRVRNFAMRFEVAEDGPEVFDKLLELLARVPVAGKQVHDASLVATIAEDDPPEALTADRVDVAGAAITFESLKKRRRGMFRAVPIPPELATMLDLVFGLRERRGAAKRELLWPWSRATAWRRVKEVLGAAGIAGPHASPKGLRHGLGVNAVGQGVPLNLVQRWLGHAQLSTTAIYAEAVGEEERTIAARMWR